MQTITFNNTNISAYIFKDADALTVTDANIVCPNFMIGDMNTNNATVHTGVTAPDDWQGGKYLFNGTAWTVNTDWTDPVTSEIAELQARIDELQG